MRHSVSSYEEDNLKVARLIGDDSGPPENPIYSNYSKHLWTSHIRHGLLESPKRSRENKNGPRQTQVSRPLSAQ